MYYPGYYLLFLIFEALRTKSDASKVVIDLDNDSGTAVDTIDLTKQYPLKASSSLNILEANAPDIVSIQDKKQKQIIQSKWLIKNIISFRKNVTNY